mgnify:CR=1 FL=1
MNKVFITKDDLYESVQRQRQKAGPLTLVLIYLGFIVSLLYLIPLVTFWLVFIVFMIPFFIIDNYILRRNK